jgi:hypothetical protein
MHNIAMAAVTALEQAGLADVLAELNTHVFERRSDDLCDEVVVGPGLRKCSYKPMVELLLREVAAVMKTKEISRDEQRTRVRWAIEMAGF